MSLPIPVAYTVMSPESTILMNTAFEGSFDDAVTALQEAGYDGVELQVESPLEFPVAAVRARLDQAGFGVSSLATGPMCQKRGLSLSSADEELRALTVADSKRLVEHAAELGAAVSFGRIMEPDAITDPARHYELLADSLAQISAHAETVGTRVLIEPQNPKLVTLITEQRAASDYLAEHGLTSVGLIFDTYHVVESDRVAAEELAGSEVLPQLVQIAETTSRAAIDYRDEPLGNFLTDLLDRGYAGWITMEHLQSAGVRTPELSLAELAKMAPALKERA
ncbi:MULTISPECIES: sugar phosphate isomerase/epimerase family protein [unclassified Diaminobutyricimonas]|uniref:sugar phosphate isomerase/epimerase family protein n=1 Tax=unclassified Diaminobutyricimonas TaxID=2643261 RepID=UPI0012F51E25|nr:MULTISPECIES: sugar phosphate isomerase/epimerase family protein [unclassified Diaminobutyricimonas]